MPADEQAQLIAQSGLGTLVLALEGSGILFRPFCYGAHFGRSGLINADILR